MELSYFLGQLLGLSLALFALAGLVRPSLIMTAVRNFQTESFAMLTGGFVAVVCGLAIILSHNIWDGTWRTWIAFFGWSALIKGCLYLIAPQSLMNTSTSFLRHENWFRAYLVFALILGLYIAYKGFGH